MTNESIKEKPPEQIYRIVKCPLKAVLKDYDTIQPIIESTVEEINQFPIIGYQFIRLYLLHKFSKKQTLPTINKQFILDVLKTIGTSKTQAGKQKSEDKIKNKKIKDDIRKFYDEVFANLIDVKLSYTNKTHILEQTAKEMLTCIETNISTHFVKHLFKYINCLFKVPKTEIIKKETDKEKRKQLYKELNQEIRDLKSDLINNEIKESKKEYHEWISKNKTLLYPNKVTKSVAYDVKVHPEKYIKHSIYINKQIENLDYKTYQFIPQRNNIVPKHITLNTCAIVDAINDKEQKIFSYPKTELILHGKKHQKHIWSQILKLEKRSIFHYKDYVFYNQIVTDGFSCSLLFILKKYKDKQFGDKLPKKVKDEDDSFTKLDSLSKEECDKYLSNDYKLVSLDPGKIRPISMINEDDKFYKYSAVRRRVETYTKRSNEIIKKEKEKNKIVEKETKLSKYNSRTLKLADYKKFITEKNKLNTEVKSFYEKLLFRKLAFRRFVRTKQSEENLLNEIENTYLTKGEQKARKKILIAFGDYSRATQMKGTIPTPNIGFKKLLQTRFSIIEVNEFNTSKLYNKTLKELINVNVRRGTHKKHLHEILTPKEEPRSGVFVNRDVNACKNILYLAKYYLKYQDRPNEFKRTSTNDKPKKKRVTKKKLVQIVV